MSTTYPTPTFNWATLGGNATAPLQAVPLQQLQAVVQHLISVLDHGAVGDGVTDDTTAIQNTLNTYAGKGVVFVPDTGHPYMTGALTIPSGTDFLIHGTVMAKANAGTLLYINGVSNVTVRGHGTLDGNGANQTTVQAVFYANNATNVQLYGLTLQNAFNWNLNVVTSNNVHVDSVRLLGGANSNEFAVGSSHCWITNSYISGVTSDGSFTFYSGVTDSGMTNCEVVNGGYGAIGVFADASAPHTVPCSNILIANNICHDNRQGAISVGGSTIQHTNIIISGNRCYNDTNGNNIYYSEIFLMGGSSISVVNNALSNIGAGNAGSNGIQVGSAASDVTITGNAIWNIGQGSTLGVGILLSNPSNVLIEGNRIYDNQTTKTMVTAFGGACGAANVIIGNAYQGVISGLGFGGGVALATDTIVASPTQGYWNVGGPIHAPVYSIIGSAAGFPATTMFQSNRAPRWTAGTDGVAESGSNAGSGYSIVPYTDGNAAMAPALTIARASGAVTIPNLSVTNNLTANIVYTNPVIYTNASNAPRWNVGNDNSIETGSPANTGSNFEFIRVNDSNVNIDAPLTITRATGAVNLLHSLGVWGAIAPASKPTVTGAKGGNTALGSLLTALAIYGLITDSTTA